MEVTLEEIQQRIQELSDDELLAMVADDPSQYLPEAVRYATAEVTMLRLRIACRQQSSCSFVHTCQREAGTVGGSSHDEQVGKVGKLWLHEYVRRGDVSLKVASTE